MFRQVQQSAIFRSRFRTGFTLIELLVVIAIISLLAAILFPVFARARENSRRAACQSNLKQIGLGVTQYLQDNDGKYPEQYYGPVVTSPSQFVYSFQVFQPYIKNKQIWICPSAPAGLYNVLPGDTYLTEGSWLQTDRVTYTMNALVCKRAAVTPPGSVLGLVTETSIAHASEVFLGWDCGNPTFNTSCTATTSYTAGNTKRVSRHFEGDNYLFTDGHVKWLPASEVPESDARFLVH